MKLLGLTVQGLFLLWPIRGVLAILGLAICVEWFYIPFSSMDKMLVYSSTNMINWQLESELPAFIGISDYSLEVSGGQMKFFKVATSNAIGEFPLP